MHRHDTKGTGTGVFPITRFFRTVGKNCARGNNHIRRILQGEYYVPVRPNRGCFKASNEVILKILRFFIILKHLGYDTFS